MTPFLCLLMVQSELTASLNGAEFDLLALSACDHVIYSIGTFGFWAGFLSGGQVFLPKNLPVRPQLRKKE